MESNAQKMWEALAEIRLLLARVPLSIKSDVACGIIAAKVKAALAAPPRNCDRFASAEEAQIAFLNDVWRISVTKDTMLESDEFENWTEEMKSRYTKWLFAEAKGGAK